MPSLSMIWVLMNCGMVSVVMIDLDGFSRFEEVIIGVCMSLYSRTTAFQKITNADATNSQEWLVACRG